LAESSRKQSYFSVDRKATRKDGPAGSDESGADEQARSEVTGCVYY
jgi:hypothetical protein